MASDNRSGNGCEGGERSDGDDDDPGWKFPAQKGDESSDGNHGIEGRVQSTGADGTNEGGDENSDDGGVDASQNGLHEGTLTEFAPEREDGDDGEESGKKNCEERKSRECERMKRRTDGRAKIGGEGEERTRESLSGTVSGEEGLLIDPAAGDYSVFKQRQNDVAASEDEGSGAVEGVEDCNGLRWRE